MYLFLRSEDEINRYEDIVTKTTPANSMGTIDPLKTFHIPTLDSRIGRHMAIIDAQIAQIIPSQIHISNTIFVKTKPLK